ncbi:hypothetical protein D9758_000177 [Tetrapyrgos nigripes]|uniref:Uncharacterized protein n=1 Tax=Tetrapyrgos nigripes TaxID=182062 RepID=A0A8H5H1T8_9AGAR|nr:hypothetical protein D9758_000177 [Tetrapyrgos nigripes]
MSLRLVQSRLCFACRAQLYQFSSRSFSSTLPNSAQKSRKPRKTHEDLFEYSKLQAYLDSIDETKHVLTPEDLARIQPPKHTDDILSAQYEAEYERIFKKLQQSFSKEQLMTFLDMHHKGDNPDGYSRTKAGYTARIIEQLWGWPSMVEVRRIKRDLSQVDTEKIPVTPPESFALLGKGPDHFLSSFRPLTQDTDGSNLRSLSKDHKVEVTFSSSPLQLIAKGVLANLRRLREHVEFVKKQIKEEFITIPSKKLIRPDLLQRISRISGAFTETFGEDQIRISYTGDPRSAVIAKRLAVHAACHVDEPPHPVLAHSPSNSSTNFLTPETYSLYPFLTVRSLPWTLNASGAFRARKVGEWYGIGNMGNLGQKKLKKEPIALSEELIVDLDNKQINLKEKLFADKQSVGNSRVVTASLGHLLLAPPSVSRGSILPPIEGAESLSHILSYVRDGPAARLFSTRTQKMIHRLVYQTVSPSGAEDLPKVLQFELYISLNHKTPHKPKDAVEDSPVEELADGEPLAKEALSLFLECRVGSERLLDLMIPDRPMDIRFSVFDSHIVAEKSMPQELQNYSQQLTSFLQGHEEVAQPDPPLILHHQSEDYICGLVRVYDRTQKQAQVRTGATSHREHPGSSSERQIDHVQGHLRRSYLGRKLGIIYGELHSFNKSLDIDHLTPP